RWLVAPEHPLTARVTVNRYWQMLFGAGLVRTTEDFGTQGEPPTHPELLDWLATEFVRTGWDVKRLLRRMATSETYKQSSLTTPLHALTLMNDVQFVEAARVLAERLLAEKGDTDARLTKLMRLATARPPGPEERAALTRSLAAFREHYRADRAAAASLAATGEYPRASGLDAAEVAAWTGL